MIKNVAAALLVVALVACEDNLNVDPSSYEAEASSEAVNIGAAQGNTPLADRRAEAVDACVRSAPPSMPMMQELCECMADKIVESSQGAEGATQPTVDPQAITRECLASVQQ